jgi:hypothetical protein
MSIDITALIMIYDKGEAFRKSPQVSIALGSLQHCVIMSQLSFLIKLIRSWLFPV